jgi:hypothetical protein
VWAQLCPKAKAAPRAAACFSSDLRVDFPLIVQLRIVTQRPKASVAR